MIDGNIIAHGSVETLKLFNSLVQLLTAAEKEGKKLSVSDVIQKLASEAYTLVGQFIDQIDKRRADFSNIDPKHEKTIDQLESERSWWELRKYVVLRNFRPKITAITNQLNMFIDDLVAVAHCKEADDLVAESFSKACERRDMLEAETNFREFR